MLSEISQTQKEIPHDLTYIWNLKKLNSESEGRTVVTRGREAGEKCGEVGLVLNILNL